MALVLLFILVFHTIGKVDVGAIKNNKLDYKASVGFTLTKKQERKLVKKIYKRLKKEERVAFLYVLGKDKTLQKYHKKYVDKKYKVTSTKKINAIFDELLTLNRELSALNLPSSVEYAFMAIGASFCTACVDGPLPVGDIVGIMVSLGAVAVIAYNWDSVASKWGAIQNIFIDIFEDSKKSIKRAFSKVKAKVENKCYSTRFKDFGYHYGEHAEEFKHMKGGNGKKPSRTQYIKMAERFLKKTSKDIRLGKMKINSSRAIKFNTVTLEYLVYEIKTEKIISYYLPKVDSYIKYKWSYSKWAKEAYEYFLKHIE